MQIPMYTVLEIQSEHEELLEESFYWQSEKGTACNTAVVSVHFMVQPELRKLSMANRTGFSSSPSNYGMAATYLIPVTGVHKASATSSITSILWALHKKWTQHEASWVPNAQASYLILVRSCSALQQIPINKAGLALTPLDSDTLDQSCFHL